MSKTQVLFLSLALFSQNVFAADYEVKAVAMGADRKLEISEVKISSKEVPASYASEISKNDLVTTIQGTVYGRDYCAADELIVTSKASSRGEYPEAVGVYEIGFSELSTSDENGLNLEGTACTRGTSGTFSLDLVTHINGYGSRERQKRWEYVIPTKEGVKTIKVKYDLATKVWSVEYSK